MRIFFLILFFFNFSTQVFPQFSPKADSIIQTGIHQIYSMQFEDAYSTFDDLKKIEPKNPAGYFFDAMVLWWQILVDLRETRFDDLFYFKLNNVIKMCDEILDENPTDYAGLYFKLGSLGFRGRLLSVRKKWFDSAMDGKDALPLIIEIAKNYPEDKDIKLGFGLFNYYADVIPKFFPFVKPLMYLFPKGDRELGLKQLTFVADSGKYAKYETQYFLLQIYFDFEKNNNKAEYYCKRLLSEFPDNPKFENYLGRIYYRTRRFPQADSVFRSILQKIKTGKTGYATKTNMRSDYYYLGALDYRMKDKTDEAIDFFKESLKISYQIDENKKSGFIKNTYKYLIKLYQRKNDTENIKYYKNLLEGIKK